MYTKIFKPKILISVFFRSVNKSATNQVLFSCVELTGLSLMMRAGSVNVSVLTEVWFVPALSTEGEVAFCKYTYQYIYINR